MSGVEFKFASAESRVEINDERDSEFPSEGRLTVIRFRFLLWGKCSLTPTASIFQFTLMSVFLVAASGWLAVAKVHVLFCFVL